MTKILRISFIVGAVYILYIAFYNSFGGSFGEDVGEVFDNVYHLMNSLVVFFGFLLLYLANFDEYLSFVSGVVFSYNALLSVFNTACLVGAKKASEWMFQNVLSGISILAIFVLIIIFFDYVRLDKG